MVEAWRKEGKTMRRLLIGMAIICVAYFALTSLTSINLAKNLDIPAFFQKTSPETSPEAAIKISPVKQEDGKVKLFVHSTSKIIEMPVEEYIVGVVAAEMPADFPPEALKAQAVASRTYIVKRLASGGVANPIHPGADVCDDCRHGQAWIARTDMRERWGLLNYYRNYYKIKKAVDDTRGMVITYAGELIDPMYHAACGGHTENSEDVWKFTVPYLRGVPCAYENYPRSEQTVRLTLSQAGRAVGVDLEAMAVSSGGGSLITVLEKTASGRPKTIRIGDKTLSSAALRDMLDLRSANFDWSVEKGNLLITTTGYGHGVGLCQYGAKGMAEHGFAYERILTHYFTGVKIEKRQQ